MIQMAIRSIMGRMVIFNLDNIDKIKTLMQEGAFVDSQETFSDEDVEENDPDNEARVKEKKYTLN